jgi:diguanylate cyclase (GGDEF)-like protein/putative nucleotidyltransferase with HDIG domain
MPRARRGSHRAGVADRSGPRTRRAPRARPPLLVVACGACLALSVITGLGLAAVVGAQVSAAGLQATGSADRALVRSSIARLLTFDDLTGSPTAARRASLTSSLSGLIEAGEIQSITIYDGQGQTLASAGQPADGNRNRPPINPEAPRLALDGSNGWVITEELPITLDGANRLGVRLERDGTALAASVDSARAGVLLALLAAGGLLSALLIIAFSTVQTLLTRQADALLETSRRDRLTGLPNHGTVVNELTELVAHARRESGWLVVGLLDIDGFDLYNTTFGHDAGDAVLAEVARALDDEMPPGAIVGRYGPDEFLVAGPASCADQIRPAILRVQDRLRFLRIPSSAETQVPLTVSAGIATYPEHAAAVSELLAAATLTLRDAKASGGNTIRIDVPGDTASAEELRNFDVLRGLVTAIDTKDHYTKRHSEEVAHYAVTIAQHLELDPAFQEAVRQAGLLHDIGKVCVPDAILRKPGPLTEAEAQVVQQHVTVGDLIVGGLPDMELVRAGIRHHHERWDGDGYPDGLRGDQIPRIARIISVADAFSAMTTTRSYRVGLPVAEAVRRMQEAAGLQLDPEFAAAFVALIIDQPEIVTPEGDPTPARLWRMSGAVA